MSTVSTRVSAVTLFVLLALGTLRAHEMTFKGTVAAIEAKRIQVKTGDEPKGQAPAWYAIGPKTKILRGKTPVTLADAHIAVGERVVVIVDHAANGALTTLDIQLAAR